MIISRTPFRVSLLGGGTDYPCWFRKNGGLAVGFAINKYSYITTRYLPPFHSFKHRIVYREIETVNTVEEIRHRAVQECIKSRNWRTEDGGLEISHLADLPGRSGTGSSSSFVVGLLNALATLQGKRLLASELAENATHIERERLGEIGGSQDQVFAAHGGLRFIKFRQNGEIATFPVSLTPERIAELEGHLLLFFTGVARTASDVAKNYARRLCEQERDQWSLMRLAEQGIAAIETGNWEKLGRLIDESWRLKRRLSGVTSPEIDLWYDTARVCGAWGGKIIGAGGGGCMLLATPPEKQAAVISAMTGCGMVRIPFKIDFDGSAIIFSDMESIREYRLAK